MMDADTETLAPFSRFFDGLEQFLDHTHHMVLVRAHDNPAVNPNDEKNPFALQLLKVLFMVKYVTDFNASLNNLIALDDYVRSMQIGLQLRKKLAMHLRV